MKIFVHIFFCSLVCILEGYFLTELYEMFELNKFEFLKFNWMKFVVEHSNEFQSNLEGKICILALYLIYKHNYQINL